MECSQPERYALFIDADNVSYRCIERVFAELQRQGVIMQAKAYTNFRRPQGKHWRERAKHFGIETIQIDDIARKKNSADIALTIDVMDFMQSPSCRNVVIVSSDSDFTALVNRLIKADYNVLGFGNDNSCEAYKAAFSRFYLIEQLSVSNSPIQTLRTESIRDNNGSKRVTCNGEMILASNYEAINQRIDQCIQQMLLNTLKALANNEVWFDLEVIFDYLNNYYPLFDSSASSTILRELLCEYDWQIAVRQCRDQTLQFKRIMSFYPIDDTDLKEHLCHTKNQE